MSILGDRQITIPSPYVDSVLAMIEQHLVELSATIEDDNESNPTRREMAAFRHMAQQLGYDFKFVTNANGFFSVSRIALQSKR
ncbi:MULTISPECIES: hypothetical protein [Pseudomonas]|uniref:Uncharacterized protein n=1 Tax=Pseudomonas pudica TaxID=272772 RepID=A0ABS0FUU1_9PSED|nr:MULTISPECIES: hypothetical protein [Pseudomonas]MBF8644127.1 hypothetical protein [Pseudomonas pudica]MBF8758506.1 hypothetical protein [Pseudomonas pudica]MDZ5110492.1 hypothetical protein [Pseudomonas putida]